MNIHIEISEESDDSINGQLSFQLSSNNSAGFLALPFVVHKVLQFPGQPPDPAKLVFMELRLGYGLRHLRINPDLRKSESAEPNALKSESGSGTPPLHSRRINVS